MELPLNVEHHITWKDVGICLGSCLRVYAVENVAEIVKNVKSIDHEYQLSFEYCISRLSVPYKISFVERLIGISSAGVYGEVG